MIRSILATVCCAIAVPAYAQRVEPPPPPLPARITSLESWLDYDASPSAEDQLTSAIIASDRRWTKDATGNLVLTVGTGRPRRLVACGLDHPGFVVSDVTDDGYLRLRRAGNAATHPLFDQFHQAQQVKVFTRRGEIPGVVAVDNLHFAQEHRGDTSVVNVDQLWVDIGARSRSEVERMGVSLIDPVSRDLRHWSYVSHSQVAGPDASGRAGCATVAMVARVAAASPRQQGQTTYVLSAQSAFAWHGLEAAVARSGPFDDVTLVTSSPLASRDSGAVSRPVTRVRLVRGTRGTPALDADSIIRLAIRSRFPGSLVETIDQADIDSLANAVRVASGVTGQEDPWLVLPTPPNRSTHERDSLSVLAGLLSQLVALPGVGNRESPVRDAIRAELPDWARRTAVQDSAGNLIVSVGPDRDTSVFLAHMDEVGYLVHSIRPNGMVTLTSQGGLNGAAWEGQPALLRADRLGMSLSPITLAGVFAPRDHATLRRPDSLEAWFGLDSAGLAARGVRVGDAVTAFKKGERIGDTRFTGRAMDDRAGDAALLFAIRDIDPSKLRHKVIFVWSVEEELGLNGATALARRVGASVHHVYAIDTFVSSDTPLEAHTFAYAPLGAGPVLRASDDGMIMTRSERERIQSIALANHIPLQVGTTKGSTDAVPFVARGAIGAQLGWPGRYSHSPAEVLDLNDLRQLSQLIAALAQ